ncbi:MAG: tetratricopeptide repeat protein [Candidatus Shapirobacteria bacterium]
MKQILKYYVRFFVLLFPIFLLPVVIDSLGFGKNWFLIASALVGLLLWIINLLVSKKQEIKTSWPFWILSLLTLWAGVTFFRLMPGNQMDSIMNPMGMGTLVGILIWLFLFIQVNSKNEFKKQFLFLTIAGVVVGVSSLVVFLLPASKLPLVWPKDNPLLSINANWSLTGSVFTEIILLIFLAMEWVKRLINKLRDREEPLAYMKEAMISAFFSLLLFLDIYKLIKLGWLFLDKLSAWTIATETLKRSPIFGIGIGNFLEAFNMFRPIGYNLTKFWSTTFNSSSVGILQIWTELGIVGLIIVLCFISGLIKKRKEKDFWQIVLFLAIGLLLPLNLITIFILVLLVANKLFTIKENKIILNVGEKAFNVMPWILSVVLFTGIVFSGFWMTRILVGEIYLKQSLVTASKNDGVGTYNLQIKAIAINPLNANYRKIYSQTNLALAQNLLANKDMSEDDKQKASTLIQQSVRESKAAISLSGNNSAYWANLAVIYKSLIGLVDGSADWSLQAYQQAVALDPINPLLNLDLGGLYFAGNKLDEAKRVFEEVVTNKNDFANGWYNLAYTNKKMNKIDVAVSQLDQALKLVPADSADYQTASKELEAWKVELNDLIKKQNEATKSAASAAVKQDEVVATPTASESGTTNF